LTIRGHFQKIPVTQEQLIIKDTMQSHSDHSHWRLRSDVVTTVLGEGAVILDLRSKFFFSANATAWAIVQMFETGATRAEIVAASQKWGANGDTPAVSQMVDQIIAEGLVEPGSPSAIGAPEIPVTAWVLPSLSKHNEPLQRIMVSAFDPGMPLAE
jgi:hypothetical protein